MSCPAPSTEDALVDLDGAILRRWSETDAAALHAAVSANIEHLRPWMPWIGQEPMTLEDRRRLLAGWEEQWDRGGDRSWGVFAGPQVVGSVGLHDRIGPGGLEIGYWLDRRVTGRGLATQAAAAVTGIAFGGRGVTRVEIRHDRVNERSGGVPRRLGYQLVGECQEEVRAPAESGVTLIWRMTRDRWVSQDASGSRRSGHDGHPPDRIGGAAP